MRLFSRLREQMGLSHSASAPRRSNSKSRSAPRARPRLELLDGRCLPSAGALDPTFGAGAGYVTTHMNTYGSWANAALIQSDGKILATGGGYFGSNGTAPPEDFAVARYNANGTLDTAFGTGGHTAVKFPGNALHGWSYSNSYAAALYPSAGTANDGKIVLAGRHDTKTDSVFALARFNANGTPDATFGSDNQNPGEVTTPFPVVLAAGAHGVVIQADGKIVAAGASTTGFVLARYNVNGTLDTTFGSGGKVVTTLAGMSKAGDGSLLLQPNGELIVTGSTQVLVGGSYRQGWELARYNANGTLDATFGSGGLAGGPFVDPNNVMGCSAALYPSGTANAGDIVVISQSQTGGELARFNPNGTLDTTFGTGGQVVSSAYFQAVAVAADGKVVAVGGADTNDIGLAVSRYTTSGSPDSTFGTGGTVTYSIQNASGTISPNGVALQPNGDIVVAANTSDFLMARLLPSQPHVGTFTANQPTPGGNVTLTAANVADLNPGTTITQVAFYADSNGDGVLEPGTDTLLGYGTQNNGVWTLTFSPAAFGLTAGQSYHVFARPEDSDGVIGDPTSLDWIVL